jgi:uncharacterized protein YfaS (alpha-2-macroglobulin family)
MLKRRLYVLLTLSLLISMTACTLLRPKATTPAPTDTVSPMARAGTPTVTQGPTSTPRPTPTPGPTPTPMPPTAPMLLFRQPERGQELQVDSPLVLTFDQAMDRTSVEKAFAIEPKIEGEFEWPNDRIMIFTPQQKWQREAVYHVAVTDTAKSQEGLSLRQGVAFRFTTTGYLEVTQVQPAAGTTGVDMDGTVTVMFNRPVVPLTTLGQMADLPDPVSFEPALPGQGEWINTSIYVYRPADGFAPSTTYQATVKAGLSDTTGGVLAEDYTWSFTTLLPQVVQVSPIDGDQYVAPTQTISVTFNQPMDPSSVEASFTLQTGSGSPVPGTYSWTDGGTTMILTPEEALARDTVYTGRVSTGAQSVGGAQGLVRSFSWTFHSVDVPRVLKIVPADGSTNVQPSRGIYVTFSAPIDRETVPEHLSISYYDPQADERVEVTVTEVYSYWQKSDTELYIGTALRPSSRYTVTVEAGIVGKYGMPVAETAISRFSTRQADPTAYLAMPGNVGTFNAYMPTTIVVGYRNISRLAFELYAVEPSTFLRWMTDWEAWDKRSTANLEALHAWTLAVAPALNETVVKRMRVVDASGDSPPPGLYYLQVSSPDLAYGTAKPGYLLSISETSVVIKRTLTSALVWATDLQSGQPVSGADVQLLTETGRTLSEGRTDGEGAFEASFAKEEMWNSTFAMVSHGDDLALASSMWNQGISPWDFGIDARWYSEPAEALFYTDRPLYRPGQTVYFKGVIRLDDDAHYTLPPVGENAEVVVQDSQGREVYSEELALSDMGTVYGEMALAEEATLGYYTIQATYRAPGAADPTYFASQFRVAEYRAPEYQVDVETDRDQYVNGDTINVSAHATYYFGGPVAQAQVRWAVLSEDYSFQWQGPGWYSWQESPWQGTGYNEETIYGGYGKLIAQGTGQTDADGRFTFALPADIGDRPVSQAYTLEVTVTDVNDQEVSNRVQAVVHRGLFYIGLSPRRYVEQVGEQVDIDVKMVDIDSATVAGQEAQVVFMKQRWYNTQKLGPDGRWYWEWEVEETPVYTTTVTSNAQGEATAAFTPSEGGSYKARATATDGRGNEIRSATTFWVSSSEWISWRRENNDQIELIADKREYAVGDTAEILVASPFRGAVKALLTIERGEILEYRVIDILTNSDVIQIPITDAYVPNVFISVVLVKGIDETNELSSFKVGYVTLPVSTDTKTLNVQLTPERDAAQGEYYHPREVARYDVQVTDDQGRGVETELSLDLVDAAVLALTGNDRGQSLLDRFYYRRGVGTATGASLVLSADRVAAELPVEDEGKGGGGGEVPGEGMIRTQFVDTAYWDPAVRTDAQGHTQIEVELPDNLTTWRLRGRGVTADTLVGEGTVDIISTLDVLVRPVVPRFFVIGDQATLSIVTHNNTETDLAATVELQAMGLNVSPGPQSVTIPAKDNVKLSWDVSVQNVKQVTLQASVHANGYSDAVEIVLPVYTYSTPEVIATSGQIGEPGERLEAVVLPQSIDTTQGELTIQVDPSLAAGMQDGLTYLESYPYECIEQTISRWLPNVLTYRALRDLGIEKPELEARLPGLVRDGLQRIYSEQKYDGGWGWWQYSQSNPYLTAYVLLGLVKAQDAGFTVENSVIQNATDYLRKQLRSPSTIEETYQLNWQAFILYVLAEADAGDLSRSVLLFDARDRLDHYGKAYLAMALGLVDEADRSRVQTLLSDLSSAAILSATGAHWEETQADLWSMGTDTRSTAIVLDAFARLLPDDGLLPNIVRWLMVARQSGHWETTQETAWALIGLTDFMVATGELNADYGYMLVLNGQSLDEQNVTRANVDQSHKVEVPIADLLEQEINRVWVVRDQPSPGQTGEGQLYYAMYLRYFLPVEEVEAQSRGIIVARQYEAVDCDAEEECPTLSGGSVGDVIRVRITLVAPYDLHYLVLEDPLPAGCEAVDRSLQTTTVVSEEPTLERSQPENQWGDGWGWWWFTHSEARDEKVALFADYVPSGTYEYTYLMRASVPGTFLTMPTLAYEMYFPEVWGRSDGGSFAIQGE